MSILDIFRKPEPQQQQQQQPPAGSQHAQANPTVPNQSNTPIQNPTVQDPNPQSPNAQFADLWKIEPTQQPSAPNFRIDPEQLQQVSGKLDFVKSVPREDLAKVAAGGEEAVEAMVNILNAVGRNVFSMNAQFASNMTESGYNNAQKAISTELPTLVKKQLSQQELFESNAKLRDPALQPLVLAIQSQVTQKYPNASPSEVNAMVSRYFSETVAGAFAKPAEENKQKDDGAFDFSSFLS